MTGHSVSEINLSPVTIEYTAIDSPDYFVIVSEDGLKKTAALVASLGSTTHLIVDEGLQIPDTAATIERLPLVRSAKKAGQFTIGLIALGALIERSEIYPTEALRESVRRHQKPGIVETNLRAIDLGSELAAD
jgi:Pyruvate/2-oxoacid:ferredoxin oxidoreductase gamma subunit